MVVSESYRFCCDALGPLNSIGDREGCRGAIERALDFLAALTEPCGAVRYHEDSRDLNTWATLFTLQALDFADGEADVRRLV